MEDPIPSLPVPNFIIRYNYSSGFPAQIQHMINVRLILDACLKTDLGKTVRNMLPKVNRCTGLQNEFFGTNLPTA